MTITPLSDILLTIAEAADYVQMRGVGAKAFWAEIAGGDMTPVRQSTATAICDQLRDLASEAE